MKTLFTFFLLFAVLLAAFLFIVLLARRVQPVAHRYRLRSRILSRAETNAFRVLQLAKPPELLMLASVRLADVIQPTARRRRGRSGYRAQLNRIIQKQLDFVLCDPQTTRPLLVIELQDASHNSERRRRRDAFVTQALDAAGCPILLLRAARSYNVQGLREQISEMLECSKIS